jgi:hypothetical protein
MKTQQFVMSTVVAVGMVCASMAQADVTTLQPKTVAAGGTGNYHDSFIGDAGSGATIGYIGTLSGGFRSEYIVQFDQLSSWIGGAEAVTNATLKLRFYYPAVNTVPGTPPSLSVYRLTNSWVNGATRTSRGGALGNWAAVGGDYDPTPVASLSFPTAPANFTIHSWDVTGLVSNWVAGTYPHNGFLLRWEPATGFDRLWYFAGPNGSGSFIAPSLTFDITVPEPSSAALLGLGGVVLWWHRRNRRP